MRIRISHETTYAYELPVRSLMQSLRVMPRDHEGQVVASWRIEPSVDGRLRSSEDAFGNLVHQFQAEGPFEAFTLRIDGVVETSDMTGFVRGAPEPLPLQVYLRDSTMTQPDEALALFARKAARTGRPPLEQLHAIMGALHEEMELMPPEAAHGGRASEAFALRKGTAVDFAHLFCGCARDAGMPARFVSGYLCGEDDRRSATQHAWAEAHVDGFGWIGFDPSLDLCPIAGHVRVATGIDFTDAMPVRTARVGGGGETASLALRVAQLGQ